MHTLIRHIDTPTVYFTGRPRDWVEELTVDHADPATWPAAQAATGLTRAELRDLLADNARQVVQIRRRLATPAGLAAWLDRQPAQVAVGQAQAGSRNLTRTVTASYLQAFGCGPYVATRNSVVASTLVVVVERPIGQRLAARFSYPAPFWARALEWALAEQALQTGKTEITAGAAGACLERALAWEQLVRAGPARPGGYRQAAERLDSLYH